MADKKGPSMKRANPTELIQGRDDKLVRGWTAKNDRGLERMNDASPYRVQYEVARRGGDAYGPVQKMQLPAGSNERVNLFGKSKLSNGPRLGPPTPDMGSIKKMATRARMKAPDGKPDAATGTYVAGGGMTTRRRAAGGSDRRSMPDMFRRMTTSPTAPDGQGPKMKKYVRRRMMDGPPAPPTKNGKYRPDLASGKGSRNG